jgi:hypothetical protein
VILKADATAGIPALWPVQQVLTTPDVGDKHLLDQILDAWAIHRHGRP